MRAADLAIKVKSGEERMTSRGETGPTMDATRVGIFTDSHGDVPDSHPGLPASLASQGTRLLLSTFPLHLTTSKECALLLTGTPFLPSSTVMAWCPPDSERAQPCLRARAARWPPT